MDFVQHRDVTQVKTAIRLSGDLQKANSDLWWDVWFLSQPFSYPLYQDGVPISAALSFCLSALMSFISNVRLVTFEHMRILPNPVWSWTERHALGGTSFLCTMYRITCTGLKWPIKATWLNPTPPSCWLTSFWLYMMHITSSVYGRVFYLSFTFWPVYDSYGFSTWENSKSKDWELESSPGRARSLTRDTKSWWFPRS